VAANPNGSAGSEKKHEGKRWDLRDFWPFALRSALAISYNALSYTRRMARFLRPGFARILWERGARGVALTCPNCGNAKNFQVKTLQMHVVQLDDGRVEVSEESRPAVFEVLCDECETALDFEQVEDALRREVLLTIGAR
jgi:hypothetical protein